MPHDIHLTQIQRALINLNWQSDNLTQLALSQFCAIFSLIQSKISHSVYGYISILPDARSANITKFFNVNHRKVTNKVLICPADENECPTEPSTLRDIVNSVEVLSYCCTKKKYSEDIEERREKKIRIFFYRKKKKRNKKDLEWVKSVCERIQGTQKTQQQIDRGNSSTKY